MANISFAKGTLHYTQYKGIEKSIKAIHFHIYMQQMIYILKLSSGSLGAHIHAPVYVITNCIHHICIVYLEKISHRCWIH